MLLHPPQIAHGATAVRQFVRFVNDVGGRYIWSDLSQVAGKLTVQLLQTMLIEELFDSDEPIGIELLFQSVEIRRTFNQHRRMITPANPARRAKAGTWLFLVQRYGCGVRSGRLRAR